MPKLISAFVLTLFVFSTALCQKKGEINTYYLNNSGAVVLPENAAYTRVVLPPDSSIDKKLYVVCEYYLNGKIKLVTGSKTNNLSLLYQGNFISYFISGKRQAVGQFVNGKLRGRIINYYPNGKIYSEVNFQPNGRIFFESCQDSIGNVLAENGNGSWIIYNPDFNEINIKGNIEQGLRQGDWIENLNNYEILKETYNKGLLITSKIFEKPGADTSFKKVDVVPEFPGGLEAFGMYLGKNIRYPYKAKIINQQGRVLISFIVEKDGVLTNLKVTKSVSQEIDEEALRVMRLSPKWKPGLIDGKPVRVAYTIPIQFKISHDL